LYSGVSGACFIVAEHNDPSVVKHRIEACAASFRAFFVRRRVVISKSEVAAKITIGVRRASSKRNMPLIGL
jgi:hypothetical protein